MSVNVHRWLISGTDHQLSTFFSHPKAQGVNVMERRGQTVFCTLYAEHATTIEDAAIQAGVTVQQWYNNPDAKKPADYWLTRIPGRDGMTWPETEQQANQEGAEVGDFRIAELHIFTHLDDQGEGLMAFLGPDGSWYPMVAADPKRMASLVPIAERMRKETGRDYRIRRFIPATPTDDVTEEMREKYAGG